MELGLSLGDPSKPFGLMEKSRREVTSNKGLGFCMALSIGSNLTDHQQNTTTSTTTEEAKKSTTSLLNADHHQITSVGSSKSPPIQLDLLPNTPVLWPSDNGSTEAAVSSGQQQEALSSSPPNSAASSFQMDFCMYSGGRKKDFAVDNSADAERASSRASDEDENGSSRKKLRLSKEQSAFLEESFKEHSTLNPKQKLALANQLNLRPRQVEVWFQNRRARTKLKQTEVDCEYLKRCCETLTEENRRLQKELQDLRALKTNSNPFFMQLPATTLTMCPSCERVATTTTTSTSTSAAATITPTTTTTTATAKIMINNNNNSSDSSTSKPTTFPLTRTRIFYPFPHTQLQPLSSASNDQIQIVKSTEKNS